MSTLPRVPNDEEPIVRIHLYFGYAAVRPGGIGASPPCEDFVSRAAAAKPVEPISVSFNDRADS